MKLKSILSVGLLFVAAFPNLITIGMSQTAATAKNPTAKQGFTDSDLREIGEFLRAMKSKVQSSKPKQGSDIRKLASAHKITVPKVLEGGSLMYFASSSGGTRSRKQVATLRFHQDKNAPRPDPQELKLICVHRCPARRDCYDICLECSWSPSLGFYCTITVSQAN